MDNPVFQALGPLSGASKTPLGPHHVNVSSLFSIGELLKVLAKVVEFTQFT
jgi:hypothetical protein